MTYARWNESIAGDESKLEQATPNEEHSKRVKIDGLGHGKKSSNTERDI